MIPTSSTTLPTTRDALSGADRGQTSTCKAVGMKSERDCALVLTAACAGAACEVAEQGGRGGAAHPHRCAEEVPVPQAVGVHVHCRDGRRRGFPPGAARHGCRQHRQEGSGGLPWTQLLWCRSPLPPLHMHAVLLSPRCSPMGLPRYMAGDQYDTAAATSP